MTKLYSLLIVVALLAAACTKEPTRPNTNTVTNTNTNTDRRQHQRFDETGEP